MTIENNHSKKVLAAIDKMSSEEKKSLERVTKALSDPPSDGDKVMELESKEQMKGRHIKFLKWVFEEVKPIETAPKDGTTIIGLDSVDDPQRDNLVRWSKKHKSWSNLPFKTPTHWMSYE